MTPTEVENVALRFDKILECACLPFDNPKYGKILKMFIVIKEGCNFDETELTEFLETKLEAYKIPKIYEVISEIPKTFNGKIDRKKLLALQ